MVKDILIGFILGVIATAIGMSIYISVFLTRYDISTTLQMSWEEGFSGALIAVGALANFGVFYLFLNKRPYISRGVLLATIVAALFIMVNKLL